MHAVSLLRKGPMKPDGSNAVVGRDGSSPGVDFEAIYQQWFHEVCTWTRVLGGPEADRDDIAQEVFLVVRRRLPAFDGRNLPGWLYRITQRQVRDLRRRTWFRHIFNQRRELETDGLPHGSLGPAAALERKERKRVLYEILDKIREPRRSTFVFFEIEGLSGEEIAQLQEVPLNTVWTRLHHARRDFFALAAKHHEVLSRAGRIGR
jgi:RNA polymerase sigma-70 factor, ECF subfamily